VTQERSDAVDPDGERVEGWPTRLSGVTETVVATEGPNGRWNHAALGISPPDDVSAPLESGAGSSVVARTFGRTRTRRNFAAGREAYVQFTTDPLDFVEAALGVYETDAPILCSSDAWTLVEVTERDRTAEWNTEIVEWSLRPIETGIRNRSVPTVHRGRAAVFEATVPASRLGIEGYDDGELLTRLESLGAVVDAAGDERAAIAFERIDELVGWRERLE
jgi:hypothetical protein